MENCFTDQALCVNFIHLCKHGPENTLGHNCQLLGFEFGLPGAGCTKDE